MGRILDESECTILQPSSLLLYVSKKLNKYFSGFEVYIYGSCAYYKRPLAISDLDILVLMQPLEIAKHKLCIKKYVVNIISGALEEFRPRIACKVLPACWNLTRPYHAHLWDCAGYGLRFEGVGQMLKTILPPRPSIEDCLDSGIIAFWYSACSIITSPEKRLRRTFAKSILNLTIPYCMMLGIPGMNDIRRIELLVRKKQGSYPLPIPLQLDRALETKCGGNCGYPTAQDLREIELFATNLVKYLQMRTAKDNMLRRKSLFLAKAAEIFVSSIWMNRKIDKIAKMIALLSQTSDKLVSLYPSERNGSWKQGLSIVQ